MQKKKTEVIYFDASHHDSHVGIGIHNVTTGDKVKKYYQGDYIQDAYISETMALIETLRYVSQRGNQRHYLLCTDNLVLYKNNISPGLRKKYLKGFDIVNLYWLPREVNTIADKLAQLPKVKPRNKKEEIRALPTNEKFAFIEKYCRNEANIRFLDDIKNNKIPEAPFRSQEKRFVNFVFACFNLNECKALEDYRATLKSRPGMSLEKFKRAIKKKNL